MQIYGIKRGQMEKLRLIFPVIPLAAVGTGQSHKLGFNAQDENPGSRCGVLPHLFRDESITRSLALCCRLNS